jgi:hypothetical protein
MDHNPRRIGALKSRHAAPDLEIKSELSRPLPDSERLAGLKRAKLRIKEEIEGIVAGNGAAASAGREHRGGALH